MALLNFKADSDADVFEIQVSLLEEVLSHINIHLGVSLKFDTFKPGIHYSGDKKFLNIDLGERPWDSVVYASLERISSPFGMVKKVEPNGLSRVAVFF